MNQKLLDLTPKHYLCPFCGEWHDWGGLNELGYYDSPSYKAELGCKIQLSSCKNRKMYIYFSDGYCYCRTIPTCYRGRLDIHSMIPIEDIVESSKGPRVTFAVPFTTDSNVGRSECSDCDSRNVCLMCKLGDESNSRYMQITFGFEFDKDEYDKIVKPVPIEHEDDEVVEREAILKQKEGKRSKEDSTMKETTQDVTKTSIWDHLYKHSPEENVAILREWANKYRPTLKWAIPVISIYAAYRILNSKNSNLTVENIDGECEKKLGFSLDFLKDKKALKELMILGGMSAGAYAAIKAVSAIYKKDDETDVTMEEIEAGMDKLDGAAKKFKWIQPKTEAMFPIATSIIIVYVMTQKPQWIDAVKDKANRISGNLSARASVYLDMLKLFITDKLHINLDSDEDAQKFKKFALLGVIVGGIALIYGKKIFGDKAVSEDSEANNERNEKLEAFISQLLSIMEKLMPTAFAGATTFLVTKHVLKAKEDVVDVEVDEDVSPEDAEMATPENKESIPTSSEKIDE